MNVFARAAFAATALAALETATPVQAQDQPTAHTPPSWETLARCADMTDPAKELECYRAAMRDAGYRPSPQAAAAEHRKSFGLNRPALGSSRRAETAKARESAVARQSARPAGPSPAASPAAEQNRLTFTIKDVAYTQPLNQLLIVTSDGAVWLQDDTIPLNFTPKPGQTVEIRKTVFGGYFCKFDRNNAMRCTRRN